MVTKYCSCLTTDSGIPVLSGRGGSQFKLNTGALEAFLFGEPGGVDIRQGLLLWGGVYVYDFLLASRLIASPLHAQAIKVLNKFKARWQEQYSQSLWQFGFLARLAPPDSVSVDAWREQTRPFSQPDLKPLPLGTLIDAEELAFMDQMLEMAGQVLLQASEEEEETADSVGARRSRTAIGKKRRKKR